MNDIKDIKAIEKNLNITDEMIIKLWKMGWTVEQISREYLRTQKRIGNKLTKIEARKYVEPMIFEYQTNLMRC